MDPEPNQPMEEVLKAYAAKRREEAGDSFELHPATRQLLQGEVSRQYPRNDRARKRSGSWLGLFGPRLVFSSGIFALLIVVSVLLFQLPVKREEVALNKRSLSEKEIEEVRRVAREPATPESKTVDLFSGVSDALADRDGDRRFGESAADRKEDLSSRSQTGLGRAEVKLELAKERDLGDRNSQLALGGRAGGVSLEKNNTPLDKSMTSPADEMKLGNKAIREKILADEPKGRLAEAKDVKKQSENFGLEMPANPAAPANKSDDLYSKESVLKRPAITAPSVASAPSSKEAKPAPARAADLGTLAASTEPVNRNLAIVGGEIATPQASDRFFDVAEDQRGQAGNSYYFVKIPDAVETQLEARRARYSTVPNENITNKVLGAFHFQVSGNQVTIVDADGSTYRGVPIADQPVSLSWGAPAQSSSANSPDGAKAKLAIVAKETAGAASSVWFKVSGTNRTLNQLVTVRGLFTASPTNSVLRADELNRSVQVPQSRGLNRPASAPSSSLPAPARNPIPPPAATPRGKVQGKVEIGQQILDLKAVESPRP